MINIIMKYAFQRSFFFAFLGAFIDESKTRG